MAEAGRDQRRGRGKAEVHETGEVGGVYVVAGDFEQFCPKPPKVTMSGSKALTRPATPRPAEPAICRAAAISSCRTSGAARATERTWRT